MKKTKIILYFVFIVFIIISTGCVNYTNVRQHPGFASFDREIKSISILEPRVLEKLVNYSGDENRLTDEEASTRDSLVSITRATLKGKGYKITEFDIEQARQKKSDINDKYEQLKLALKQAYKKLYGNQSVKVEDMANYQVSLGFIANEFSKLSGTDALLLLNYSGYQKSQGRVAKDVVAASVAAVFTGTYIGSAESSATLDAALIDGKTGDVLWANVARGDNHLTKLMISFYSHFPDYGENITVATGQP